MPHVTILSPHCDDAPLSVGASILTGTLGFQPSVIVVFSVSRYTKDSLGTGVTTEITALRRSEELRAAQIADYSLDFLGFEEPFVRRGFSSLDDIMDLQRTEQADQTWPAVSSAIYDIIARFDGSVLAPLGCGGHIDHRIVHEAAVRASRDLRACIGFYEDLPYAGYLSQADILAQVARHDRLGLHPMLTERGLSGKLDLLKVYGSQLEQKHFDVVSSYWRKIGGERLWLPREFPV
jgi:LmbE family N-acetylglucosaminyl deacetylase